MRLHQQSGKLVVVTLYDEIAPYSQQAKGKRNGRWEKLLEAETLAKVVDEGALMKFEYVVYMPQIHFFYL